MNPFSASSDQDETDRSLIKKIKKGDRQALTHLIERHQPYIYNLAWKMIGDPMQAEDLSQEALIKIITNLGSFKQESSFRTWAYRIVRNHFINDQKKSSAKFASNFEDLGYMLDSVKSIDLTAEEQQIKAEEIREVRLQCLSGMLLCLTKEQRMIYIIGEIFKADHNIGSDIMGISKANFRMKLSKARKDLHNFMENKCGLVNKSNPCRCHKKVTVSLETGLVDAKDLLFNQADFSTFQAEIEPDANYLTEESEHIYAQLHQGHSFKTQFDKTDLIVNVLKKANWKNRLNLN